MAVAAKFRGGRFFHANCVIEPIAMDAFEGCVVFASDVFEIIAKALRLVDQVHTIL